MPKCLECGLEALRLQWTHFKYNCTGRFNNGKEYMEVYPGARVVDESLAKRTAVTLRSMINKYGSEEGAERWEAYRKKQAYTNSLEYKQDMHGWSREDFDAYNSSRAVTVENMVARHGEQDGLRKWDEYCDRQKITKSRDYVVAKYGTAYWNELCRRKYSPHYAPDVAILNNISLEEAVAKIASRYRVAYASNLELELVEELEKFIGPIEHSNKKSPFGKWNHEKNTYVVYDIKHRDCIIEFNGDYWHANPMIYQADDLIRGTPAKELWEKDRIKLEIAKAAGFRTYVVWEKDYLDNKQKIIRELIAWIQNTIK